MFDVDLAGGESYRESRNYRAGELAVAADLPWGRLGLTICYDLRFPALYRALAEAGATFLAIPSALLVTLGVSRRSVPFHAAGGLVTGKVEAARAAVKVVMCVSLCCSR